MGLLKNILGSVVSKAIQDVIGTATAQNRPASAPSARPATPNYNDEVPERTPAEWKSYFREILQSEFGTYTVKENVPVTDIAGYASDEFQLYRTRPRQVYRAEWGQPYTFVLYQGLHPKGVVMLGDGHSHDANVKYLVARMFAKKSGLPYINFYTQMPNERGYVVSRIKRFI